MSKTLNRKTFINVMEQELKIERFDSICLALSGGIDSMVLANLLLESDFHFSIAHCNFNLRGEESTLDYRFVQNWAKKNSIPFYSISFETEEYAQNNKLSIEMAARELRYNWFDQLINEYEFKAMMVAHHRDDSLETFLLNLARGTGIRGLTGIDQIKGRFVRPLISFSRVQIEEYAKLNQLTYREDKSNESTIYRRNKVRHDILPQLDELNPSFRTNMMRTIAHLQAIQSIALEQISLQRTKIVKEENKSLIKIEGEALLSTVEPTTYLFEYIKEYGFNGKLCKQIIQSLEEKNSGKEFFSISHRIVLDRGILNLMPIAKQNNSTFIIHYPFDKPIENSLLELSIIEVNDSFRIERNPNIAYIDLDKISESMLCRHWKQGDTFRPLGMRGKKKISDFFVDKKFSLMQKEETWLLTHKEDIVWVVGHRMDDRFKVTNSTRKILRCTYIK